MTPDVTAAATSLADSQAIFSSFFPPTEPAKPECPRGMIASQLPTAITSGFGIPAAVGPLDESSPTSP